MNKLSKTSHHLSVCSANYRRIKKILTDFTKQEYKFLLDESDVTASFKIIDKQNHTLLIEAAQSTSNSIMKFKFRLQIFLDARLAEVVSYQNEKSGRNQIRSFCLLCITLSLAPKVLAELNQEGRSSSVYS